MSTLQVPVAFIPENVKTACKALGSNLLGHQFFSEDGKRLEQSQNRCFLVVGNAVETALFWYVNEQIYRVEVTR